ncbi:hypothetical protein IMY05_C5296000400 [Salix suchowensis]|nr:hypothetical protein IMY05_C5296000400 [Salix suchowensis]
MKMGTHSGFWMGSTHLFHGDFNSIFGGQSNMAFMCYRKGEVIIDYKEKTSNGGPLQSPIFSVRSLNQSNSQNMESFSQRWRPEGNFSHSLQLF